MRKLQNKSAVKQPAMAIPSFVMEAMEMSHILDVISSDPFFIIPGAILPPEMIKTEIVGCLLGQPTTLPSSDLYIGIYQYAENHYSSPRQWVQELTESVHRYRHLLDLL